MMAITIRPARPDEFETLSALAKRSKAYWGYDAAFMRLSEASLTIAPALIATRRVRVAENAEGDLLGFASLAPLEDGAWDLLHMFVEPAAIGTGAGTALFPSIRVVAGRL